MTARNCGGGGAMYQRQKLAPLSPAEQDVAAQNFLLIERFIASRKLPRDEYFDVVVFGYLLAIKKWFNRPELYRYEFSTKCQRANFSNRTGPKAAGAAGKSVCR